MFKDILKKKKVLYIGVGILVVITGIIIWGAVTDWKFWNYSKNKYPYLPDNVSKKHACHKSKCNHCNSEGTVCEECLSGYIKDSKNNCVHEKKCDQDCLNCSDDGQKCLQCKGDLVLGKNGICCQKLSKDKDGNSVCCDEQIDGQCCPPGTKSSRNPITTKKRCCSSGKNGITRCCNENESLYNNGKCCPTNKLCNGLCCNSDNICKDGKCMIETKCPNGKTISCDGSKQEVVSSNSECYCKDLGCTFEKATAQFPRVEYEGDKTCTKQADCFNGNMCVDGKCQYKVYGIKNKNNDKLQEGKYFLFNNGEILTESQEMIYQQKRIESDGKNACQDSDCAAIDIPGAIVGLKNNTFTNTNKLRYCLTQLDAPDSTIKPLCPFEDTKRCCMIDTQFTGQVCDKNNICVIKDGEKIGNCFNTSDCLGKNKKVCSGNGKCQPDGNNGAKCVCDPTYSGDKCQIANPCSTELDNVYVVPFCNCGNSNGEYTSTPSLLNDRSSGKWLPVKFIYTGYSIGHYRFAKNVTDCGDATTRCHRSSAQTLLDDQLRNWSNTSWKYESVNEGKIYVITDVGEKQYLNGNGVKGETNYVEWSGIQSKSWGDYTGDKNGYETWGSGTWDNINRWDEMRGPSWRNDAVTGAWTIIRATNLADQKVYCILMNCYTWFKTNDFWYHGKGRDWIENFNDFASQSMETAFFLQINSNQSQDIGDMRTHDDGEYTSGSPYLMFCHGKNSKTGEVYCKRV
jgi:hypothetical protein